MYQSGNSRKESFELKLFRWNLAGWLALGNCLDVQTRLVSESRQTRTFCFKIFKFLRVAFSRCVEIRKILHWSQLFSALGIFLGLNFKALAGLHILPGTSGVLTRFSLMTFWFVFLIHFADVHQRRRSSLSSWAPNFSCKLTGLAWTALHTSGQASNRNSRFERVRSGRILSTLCAFSSHSSTFLSFSPKI